MAFVPQNNCEKVSCLFKIVHVLFVNLYKIKFFNANWPPKINNCLLFTLITCPYALLD